MPEKQKSPRIKSVEKSRIPDLPIMSYDGPVSVITDDGSAADACAKLAAESLIGFDTETRPAFRKGESYLPSLIQLAGSDIVYLIQLQYLNDYSPLIALLENPDIKKVGVAIHDDIIHLNEIFTFEPQGFLDLRTMATSAGLKNNGLRNLAAAMLGGRISKRAQTSNWSNPKLQPFQIQYAATDAWACREIYYAFRKKGVPEP